MQLSEKPKACSQFVIDFLESTLNFEHFEKNMSLIVISEVIDSERRTYLNA